MPSFKLPALSLFLAIPLAFGQQPEWAQCGGIGYTGSTTCASPYVCTVINAYYYQCLPSGSGSTVDSTTVRSTTTTTTTIHTTVTTTTTSATSTPTSLSGIPRVVGVNFAGWDFGTQTDGSTHGEAAVYPPSNNQISHFQAEGVNIYRIPIGWQALQPTLGGAFNQTAWTLYQANVNAALNSGAYVIIDIHNYARWNGGIIGQGGPTNDQFANLWSGIASVYKSNTKVIFGLMNEPHDLTLSSWATSCQAAVNAIRNAGATKNPILIPGDNWTSASTFTSWYQTMNTVTDPVTANGNSLLLFDHHRYLDSDGSGTHATCVDSRVSEFQANVAFLKSVNRQAILSEVGGGNDPTCLSSPGYLVQAINYIASAYPYYIGVTGWGAGSFDQTYVLSLSPVPNYAVSASDSAIWTQAFKPSIPH